MDLSCIEYEIITDVDDKFLLCKEWTFDLSSLFFIAGVAFFIFIVMSFIRKI